MSAIIFPLILSELGGRVRRVILSGSDLPSSKGSMLSVGGRQRASTVWYPGALEPTVQIMGPAEDPLEFAGMFEDHKKSLVGHAIAQQFLIDDIRKAGHLVQIEYGAIIRTCRWDSATFTILGPEQIGYQIKLEVVSTGRGSPQRVIDGLRRIPGAGAVVDAIEDVQAVIVNLPPGVAPDALQRAAGSITQAATAAAAASGVLDAMGLSTSSDPQQAKGALTDLGATKAATSATLAQLRELDWKGAAGSVFDAVTQHGYAIANSISKTVRVAQEIGLLSPQIEKLAGESTRTLVYIVGGGETLQRIAQRVLGSSLRWPEIMSANNMKSTEIEAGQRLVINNPPERAKAIAP